MQDFSICLIDPGMPALSGLKYCWVVHQMELVGVRVELPANTPMMLLKETDGDRRLLPILIGNPEIGRAHV